MAQGNQKSRNNNVRALREEILMSKAELARKAGISALTVDRIENGADCRLDTKRKIILALGKKLSEKELVFPQLAAREADIEAPGPEAEGAGRSRPNAPNTREKTRKDS